MMPGLDRHRRVTAKRAYEYWYAWRGGPRILAASASNEQALDREVAKLAPAAIAQFEQLVGAKPDGRFLAGLITQFLESSHYQTKAPRTRADYRAALDVVRRDLGEMDLAWLEKPKARAVLIDWRDKYKATPKTADARMGALALVLQWARDRGQIAVNPLQDFPRLYRVNRADLVWTEADLALILPHLGSDQARNAVLFAAYSGLRLGDLVTLPWSAVKDDAIIWQTGKSGRRRTVIIPITPELRGIIDRLPTASDTGAVTVLTSSHGRPWTDEGLQTAMQRAKQKVHAAVRKSDPTAVSPVQALRFHDLRGTAATNLVRAGLSLEDVATILGWEKRKVESIAMRYVNGETIALAIVERMKRSR